jgi:hypothetical protein
MEVLKDLKNQIRSLSKKALASDNQTISHQSDNSMMMDSSSSVGNKSGIVDPNKMNQRLKEIFREKISTFREAVYMLTGFRVRFFVQ